MQSPILSGQNANVTSLDSTLALILASQQTRAERKPDDDEPPAGQEGEGTRHLQQAGTAVQVHHAVRYELSPGPVSFGSFQHFRTQDLGGPRSRVFVVIREIPNSVVGRQRFSSLVGPSNGIHTECLMLTATSCFTSVVFTP